MHAAIRKLKKRSQRWDMDEHQFSRLYVDVLNVWFRNDLAAGQIASVYSIITDLTASPLMTPMMADLAAHVAPFILVNNPRFPDLLQENKKLLSRLPKSVFPLLVEMRGLPERVMVFLAKKLRPESRIRLAENPDLPANAIRWLANAPGLDQLFLFDPEVPSCEAVSECFSEHLLQSDRDHESPEKPENPESRTLTFIDAFPLPYRLALLTRLARHQNLPVDVADLLSRPTEHNEVILMTLAQNQTVEEKTLDRLCRETWPIRFALTDNPGIPSRIIQKLAQDDHPGVRQAAARHL